MHILGPKHTPPPPAKTPFSLIEELPKLNIIGNRLSLQVYVGVVTSKKQDNVSVYWLTAYVTAECTLEAGTTPS